MCLIFIVFFNEQILFAFIDAMLKNVQSMHSDDESGFLTSLSKKQYKNIHMVVIYIRNRIKVNKLYIIPLFSVSHNPTTFVCKHMVLFPIIAVLHVLLHNVNVLY